MIAGALTACVHCSESFAQSGRGRPRLFCQNCNTSRHRNQRWKAINPEGYSANAHRAALAHKKKMREAAAGRERPDVCDVCGGPPGRRNDALAFDHDHATGKFRGWLCFQCNVALGLLRDDPTRLRALAAYVEAHQLTGVHP